MREVRLLIDSEMKALECLCFLMFKKSVRENRASISRSTSPHLKASCVASFTKRHKKCTAEIENVNQTLFSSYTYKVVEKVCLNFTISDRINLHYDDLLGDKCFSFIIIIIILHGLRQPDHWSKVILILQITTRDSTFKAASCQTQRWWCVKQNW